LGRWFKMNYIIHNGIRPLNYFYPNNNFNGTLKDIIGFSWKNYATFPTEKEAHNHLKYLFCSHRDMIGDLKLSIRLFNLMEKLKIKEVIENGIKQ